MSGQHCLVGVHADNINTYTYAAYSKNEQTTENIQTNKINNNERKKERKKDRKPIHQIL